MSLYRNPWSPGYAIPGYVDAEPRGRGTFTTAQLRRRTISEPPKGWTGGYALPENVEDEPAGEGTITTNQIKRRTISQFVPDFLLGRRPGDALAFAETPGPGMSGLGDAVDLTMKPVVQPGFPGDPIAAYGKTIAAYIMQQINTVHAPQRVKALRELLAQVDSDLWTTVAQKAEEAEKMGYSAKAALQRALAASLSDGLARELVNIGLTGKMPRRGQTAIAAFGCAQAMDGFWDKVKSAAGDVWDFTKDVGNFIEKVGCRALGSQAMPYAAGIAGQAAGVPAPAGAAGAKIAADATGCSSSDSKSSPKSTAPQLVVGLAPGAMAKIQANQMAQAQMYAQAPGSGGIGMGTILLVGGGIAAYLLLRKKGG